MGIVRNRVFANTYGAGAELDAYNAAFRIPEVALDVLVAAGLTAPFVPIYSRLRHDDGGDAGANDFGRTVLTGAVGVMTIASILIFIAAPWLAGVVGEHFDASTQALYVELVRINCLAQVLFAASIALGEILVANRRFLFYALAPVLYSGGIIVFTVLFAGRFGIVATAWGAVAGAVAHLGIRAIGTTRTSFRIRPGLRGPDGGVRGVPAADVPADVLGRHRAADDHLLHPRRERSRRRRGVVAQLRARLPGAAGQPDRRRRSRWRSSRCSRRRSRTTTARAFARSSAGTS